MHHKDYPAIIKHAETSTVDGLLFRPATHSQRKKLDDFEGETYHPTPVFVQTAAADGKGTELIEADIYLWNGDPEALSDKEWKLEEFVQDRLDDWLELFGGMELIGDDAK